MLFIIILRINTFLLKINTNWLNRLKNSFLQWHIITFKQICQPILQIIFFIGHKTDINVYLQKIVKAKLPQNINNALRKFGFVYFSDILLLEQGSWTLIGGKGQREPNRNAEREGDELCRQKLRVGRIELVFEKRQRVAEHDLNADKDEHGDTAERERHTDALDIFIISREKYNIEHAEYHKEEREERDVYIEVGGVDGGHNFSAQ